MSNFFWVGGSGNWTDSANHWSATSGGAPGAGVPGSTDDCIFDINSFTAGSKTVTFNTSPNVKSMDFTGATNNPSVIPTNSATINGNLTLIAGMNFGTTGATLTFNTTGTTVNLTTAGVTLGVGNVVIAGSGTFNLQDNLTIGGGVGSTFRAAGASAINTNNFNITTGAFQGTVGATDTINLGSSTITLTNPSISGLNLWALQAGQTLNAGTSNIICGGSPAFNFVGASKTYNNVSFTGGPVTMSGTNTFNSITISAGQRVNFPISVTQTVTTFTAIGTAISNILLRSTTAGTQASLCVTTWNLAYVDAKDINASCATAIDCTGANNGNNSGFDFCTGRAFLLNLI